MDNIIETNGVTIVMNGGNPLSNCPSSYEEFYKWVDEANENKDEYYEPKWNTDCGYKLDFDGPLISISSRFYPPKTHYGPTWDGNVTVYLLGNELEKKHFDKPTFKELVSDVHDYIKSLSTRIILTQPPTGGDMFNQTK